MTRQRRRWQEFQGSRMGGWLILVVLASWFLGACSPLGDDEPSPTPAPPTEASTPDAPAATPAAEQAGEPEAGQPPAATLDPASARRISGGFCTALIPITWVADATGAGRTPTGDRFRVFGGRLSGEEAWEQAVSLVTAAAGEAEVIDGDGFVRVIGLERPGLIHRQRFDDRYCDVRITPSGGPLDEDIQATWDAITQTLAPAAAPPAASPAGTTTGTR